MKKNINIMNFFVINQVTEEKKESWLKKLWNAVKPAAITVIVNDVWKLIKKTMPYIQQAVFAVCSCFCPAGVYAPNIPPVEDYRQEAQLLRIPDYFPKDGFKPSFAEQFTGN